MSRSLVFICLLVVFTSSVSAQRANISWKEISQLSLTTLDGKSMRIKGGQSTVFVMLSPECPLCRNYVPVLNSLKAAHPEVAFYGVFPGKSYSSQEVGNFQKEYQLGISILLDPQKKLVKALNATTTPECLFINEIGILAYRGLIDNWPSSLGQKRKVVTEQYLADALEKSKENQPVMTKETKPVGCLINDL